MQSEQLKNTFFPYWAKIEGGILFRGTYHELKAQEVIINIQNKELIGSKNIGTKIVPLREVIDIAFLKSDMVIHRKVDSGPILNDEDLDKQAQTCEIQGTVNIAKFPKWRQKGEDELVGMRERYLCIKINEANVFGDLNDGGEALVWCEVVWGGLTKKTRQFKRANVN